MKKFLFAGVLGMFASCCLCAHAWEPTTMWPYLFEDFTDASLCFTSGDTGKARVNIHLLRNDLHYLNGSKIYTPDNQNEVSRIVLLSDSTTFVRCENYFVEVLGETAQAIVGRRTNGDFDRLLQKPGAYGTSSSTSAVDNLSSLQIGGVSNLNYDLIRVERENSETLPLSVRFCFVIEGTIYNANKRTISKLLPKEDRKEFNAFLKKNKVKWNRVEGLQQVLEYISPLLAEQGGGR